jgi:Putative zinc finger motif, C2HC5-type
MQILRVLCLFKHTHTQDLLDYLVQLLGSDRHDRLVDFVDNVERFQRGDPVVSLADEQAAQAPPLAAVPTKKPALVTLTSKKAPAPPRPSNKSVASAASALPPTKKEIQAAANPSPPFTADAASPATATATATTTRPSNRNKKKAVELQEQNQKPKRPPQGKASSTECGCFGSLHKALTNCLHCGRISCEREGYDYCPFCGYLVEEVVRDTATTVGYVFVVLLFQTA